MVSGGMADSAADAVLAACLLYRTCRHKLGHHEALTPIVKDGPSYIGSSLEAEWVHPRRHRHPPLLPSSGCFPSLHEGCGKREAAQHYSRPPPLHPPPPHHHRPQFVSPTSRLYRRCWNLSYRSHPHLPQDAAALPAAWLHHPRCWYRRRCCCCRLRRRWEAAACDTSLQVGQRHIEPHQRAIAIR